MNAEVLQVQRCDVSIGETREGVDSVNQRLLRRSSLEQQMDTRRKDMPRQLEAKEIADFVLTERLVGNSSISP